MCCNDRESIIEEAQADALSTVRWAAWQRVKSELMIMQRTHENGNDKDCEMLFRFSAQFISTVEGGCLHE